MRRALLLVVALLGGLPVPALGAATVSIRPAADVGFPFFCDWGYDWESRCFRDDGIRLPVGGVDDKVWRAGLRFSLARIPARAEVAAAELRVYHDGSCAGPARTVHACAAPGAVVDLHRLLTSAWLSEREPDFDPHVLGTAVVFSAPDPQWLSWDVTTLVRDWLAGLPNHGVLLKLQDGDEGYGVDGLDGPSSSHPDAALRPQLRVTYVLSGPR